MLTPFSFAQCSIVTVVAGHSARQARSTPLTTQAIPGPSCARRHVAYYSAGCLSTTIAAGWLAQAPRSYKRPTVATRGTSRHYRKLKNQYASRPLRLSITVKDGQLAVAAVFITLPTAGERGNDRNQWVLSICLTLSSSMLSKAGQSAPREQSFIQPTAGSIGPPNAAAPSTPWNACSSPAEIVAGPWVSAARSWLI